MHVFIQMTVGDVLGEQGYVEAIFLYALLQIDVGYINTCHIVIKSVLNDGKYSRE